MSNLGMNPQMQQILLAQLLQGQQAPQNMGQGLASLGNIGNTYLMAKLLREGASQQKQDQQSQSRGMASIMGNAIEDPKSGAFLDRSTFQNAPGVSWDLPEQTSQPGDMSSFLMAARQDPQNMGQYADIAKFLQGEKPEPFTLSPGQTRFDGGRQVASLPPAPEKTDDVLVEIADPTDPTGQRGVMVPRSQAAGKPTKMSVRERMPRVKTYYDENGNPITLDANDPDDQAKIRDLGLVESAPTEAERVSKGYLDRMTAAETNMQGVTDGGYDPANFKDKNVKDIPLFGNYWVSDQGRLFTQAQEDWVRAKLRKESGAVIADEEMEREIRTYFPQPGDDPATIAQKTASRKQAERQLATTAGILGRPYLRTPQEQPNKDPGSDAPNVAQHSPQQIVDELRKRGVVR